MSAKMLEEAAHDEPILPIRAVTEETGVATVTLRAWERRYGFPSPKRTASGHRLYSRQDIDSIKQVLELLDDGVPISVAQSIIRAEVNDYEFHGEEPTIWQDYLHKMQDAICRFDTEHLAAYYDEAMSVYPLNVVLNQILLPLLEQLGNRWASGEGTVAEEHFFGVFMRNKLGARFHRGLTLSKGVKVVLACMQEEYHDFGLLLLALVAREQGFSPILLGANTPLSDYAGVLKASGAEAVVLSVTSPMKRKVFEELTKTIKALPKPVFIGGAGSLRYSDQLEEVGAIVVGAGLAEGVRQIRKHLC